MRGIVVTSLALAAVAPIAGCQIYDPALVGGDAGPSASRQPPTRPTAADGDSVPDVMFGMRMVVMSQGDDWPVYGYDVDRFDTRAPDFGAECVPPTGGRALIDGVEGVDNIFGKSFFPLVELTTPDLEASSQEAQEMGQGLPIMRLSGWNGQDDDPRVDVHIAQAVYGMPGGDETTPPPPPADPSIVRPAWDGRDWFWVRDDAFFMGMLDRPLIRDDNAYVAGRLVVARLPDRIDIIFPADEYGVLVRLTDALITGTISADDQTLENVIVAGRWAIIDLLGTARNIGVCTGSTEYNLLVGQLDTIADVRSSPGTGGPGVECDAISLGVGFTGTRLRIAGIAAGPPLADLCTRTDGGVGDGGAPDAGVPDGGPLSEDGGPLSEDAGSGDGDAGPDDAGIDAGPGATDDGGMVAER